MQTRDYRSDEIDLLELFLWLWKKKRSIVLTTLVSILIGLIVIFFSKSLYEATVYLEPPSSKDIHSLMKSRIVFNGASLKRITGIDVYREFRDELNTESNKIQFFATQYLPKVSSKGNYPLNINKLKQYVKLLTITRDQTSLLPKYNVTLRAYNPKQTTLLLEQYIDAVNKKTVAKIEILIKEESLMVKTQIKKRIEQLQNLAAIQRVNRIDQLRKALTMAETHNVKTSDSDHSSYNSDTVPLYKLRSIKLQEEIANLQDVKPGDESTNEIRELEYRYNALKDFKPDLNNLKTYGIALPVQLTPLPVAPDKKLILLIFTLLGFTLGCVLAIISFIRKTRVCDL